MYLLPKIFVSVPELLQPGVVYQFSCKCGSEYIGETKRSLRKRISEHHTHNRANVSPIYKHVYIDKCIYYQKYLSDNYGSQPSKTIEIMCFEKHFKTIKRNLHNYRIRTDMEAIIIRLRQPDLNIQVPSKNVKLI